MTFTSVIHIMFTLVAVVASVAVYDRLLVKKFPKWAAILGAFALIFVSWFLFGWFAGQFFG